MFEAMEAVMIEFIGYFPYLFGIWLIFSFTGALLFDKR